MYIVCTGFLCVMQMYNNYDNNSGLFELVNDLCDSVNMKVSASLFLTKGNIWQTSKL